MRKRHSFFCHESNGAIQGPSSADAHSPKWVKEKYRLQPQADITRIASSWLAERLASRSKESVLKSCSSGDRRASRGIPRWGRLSASARFTSLNKSVLE